MIYIEKLLCKVNLHRPTCKYRTDEDAKATNLGYFRGYFCRFCDKPLDYRRATSQGKWSIGVWG